MARPPGETWVAVFFYMDPDPANDSEWKRVVYSADCDEDGNCPQCGDDFGECPCPGPTMDEMEYMEDTQGVLWARPIK